MPAQPENENTLIGRLTEVSGASFVATLLSEEEGFSPTKRIGMEEIAVGQIGSTVAIKSKSGQLLCQITRMWEEEKEVRMLLSETASGTVRRSINLKRITLMPLGEVDASNKFQRGVNRFPTTGAEVHLVPSGTLATLFEKNRVHGYDVGRLSSRSDLRVYLDPNPFFGRHLAILGQSGSGKSWTVTSLLQRTISAMPNAHIVLLDLHGEYGWKDSYGELHSPFSAGISRRIDARDLEIPYWLLTYAELTDLLIDRSDPNASLQMAFLRESLHNLRKKANLDLGISGISVDSPVFFSIKELYMLFKKANEQQADFGKTKGPLFGVFDEFLVRFQSMFNDSRYDFLLKPKKRTESESLEHLIRDFIGLGEPKSQITIIDFSPIPADVRPTVSAQIGRLAFEFNLWNPERRDFPILLVCEEAHAYIPRDVDAQQAGTRKAMERIAKEGRKYGVGLAVVSQRPTELSETVLAQCANFVCLRISNPDDQAYIRRLMPEGQQDMADMLSSLRRGEAVIMGEATPLPVRAQIYPPDPPPASADVPLSDAWRHGPEDLDIADVVKRWWSQTR